MVTTHTAQGTTLFLTKRPSPPGVCYFRISIRSSHSPSGRCCCSLPVDSFKEGTIIVFSSVFETFYCLSFRVNEKMRKCAWFL